MARFTALVASLMLTAAVAFTPSVKSSSRTAVTLAAKSKALPFLDQPKKLDGSLAGDAGFDPLGLSEIEGIGADLYWMREAELKHARVAMLATVGVLFVEGCGSMPGFPEGKGQSQMDVFWDVWAEHPNYIAAALTFFTIIEGRSLQLPQCPCAMLLPPTTALVPANEFTARSPSHRRSVISGVATTAGRESGLRDAGDFGFNPLGFKDTMEMRTKEIANGRLAMLAAAGMIMQGMTTHNGCLTNLLTGE